MSNEVIDEFAPLGLRQPRVRANMYEQTLQGRALVVQGTALLLPARVCPQESELASFHLDPDRCPTQMVLLAIPIQS
jgi:hypothetical protein